MIPRRNRLFAALAVVLLLGGGAAWVWYENQKTCCGFPDEREPMPEFLAPGEGEPLGLMSSLPLYWHQDANFQDIASGIAPVPWQRWALSRDHDLVLLDTLSPIAGLTADAPDTDPLVGLDRLAVIQPRGLSASDNVALDDWVRAGGQLLLVLDPMLTGDYDLPLGDPRLPTPTALIPPVVARWGLEIVFDESQADARSVEVPFGTKSYDLFLAGDIRELEGISNDCVISGEGALAVCRVGDGTVTLLSDAGVWEHGPGFVDGEAHGHGHESDENRLAIEGTKPLIDLMRFAFSR